MRCHDRVAPKGAVALDWLAWRFKGVYSLALLADKVGRGAQAAMFLDSAVRVAGNTCRLVEALKGFFDRTFQPGSSTAPALGGWEFPPKSGDGRSETGLKPLLTNVKRVAGVSTYGATQQIAFLAGDNGRNCISTAIRHGNFAPDCTCLWLGLYAMDSLGDGQRQIFLERVRETFRSEF